MVFGCSLAYVIMLQVRERKNLPLLTVADELCYWGETLNKLFLDCCEYGYTDQRNTQTTRCSQSFKST